MNGGASVSDLSALCSFRVWARYNIAPFDCAFLILNSPSSELRYFLLCVRALLRHINGNLRHFCAILRHFNVVLRHICKILRHFYVSLRFCVTLKRGCALLCNWRSRRGGL
jgi:hypothetical protein